MYWICWRGEMAASRQAGHTKTAQELTGYVGGQDTITTNVVADLPPGSGVLPPKQVDRAEKNVFQG